MPKKIIGSAAFTVSEETRIRLTKQLTDLRENNEKRSITFPSNLTNVERKFIHALAQELGMLSKSTGSKKIEGARTITVSKLSSEGIKT